MSDHMRRLLTGRQDLAVSHVAATATCQAIVHEQQGLRGEPARVLGEAVLGALLLATRLRGRGLVILQLQGEGVFSHLRVDAIGLGTARALVRPALRAELQAWDGRDPLLGAGRLVVARRLEGSTKDYESSVLTPAEPLAQRLDRFLVESEQVTARVALDLQLDGDGRIAQAAGAYLEAMPEVPGGEAWLSRVDQLGAGWSRQEDPLDGLVDEPAWRLLMDYPVVARCHCSAERFTATLRTFPASELDQLADDGHIVTTCDFCNSRYRIPLTDLRSGG
jgi:molecular chaperone Hsp33